MDAEQDYTWIGAVRDALLAGELVEPPDWVRHRARQLFHEGVQKRGSGGAAPKLVERVRAALIFDSRQGGLAPAGVRANAITEGPWQLLYRSGDVDIDLLVRPSQDGRTMSVRGQALSVRGQHFYSGVVEALPSDNPRPLHGDARVSARSDLEPSGEFALSNLERGRYDVLVRFGAREIELSGVEF